MFICGLLFLSSAHAAATPRSSLDDQFFVQVGRAGWDPFSRRELPDIFPFGYQIQQPLADKDYLRRPDPYIRSASIGNTGFVLDCETAFTYDVCLNRAKRVCDAFCQNMCREHCGGFDSADGVMVNTTELIACLNRNELNNCAYRYGQVTSLPVASTCQTTLKQSQALKDGGSALVEIEAVTVDVDWAAFVSKKFKHIRRVLLELHHSPADADTTTTESTSTSTDSTTSTTTANSSSSASRKPLISLLYNETMPQDSTNIVRLIKKVRTADAPHSPCGLTARHMPVIWSDLDVMRWQRLNTFGLPYYMDEQIYQIDLTHLYNNNVWNSIGTDSTILIWFNRAQPDLIFEPDRSRLIVFADFSLSKIITKNDIKSTRILTQTATFNDRITEF